MVESTRPRLDIAKACEMLTEAQTAVSYHESATTPESRKAKGQFFTPSVVAEFMANMFCDIPTEFRMLDAGAGVGTLTAAVCERIMNEPCRRIFHADLYETDVESIPRLRHVLDACSDALVTHGHNFSYSILDKDFAFATTRQSLPLFTDEDEPVQYDLAIMNPPYFKIGADSEHARAASQLGVVQPNIYSLFLAMAVECLRPNGELVAITPRSYCNGRYFRPFRQWLFQRVSLEQVHSFASRTETFKESQVLQESIITRFRKTLYPTETVKITRSFGRDFSSVETQQVGRNRIIDNSCGDNLICIPETREDSAVVEVAESWSQRFADMGLRISTGPVVMFRTRQFHVDKLGVKATVPLFASHHIKRTGLYWPNQKPKWPEAFAATRDSRKHLVPRDNYLLVKRFTSKEERRRLTASAIFSDTVSSEYVAFENHINYVRHAERSLSLSELCGLEAVFNSVILDRYFRSFSGNTQVNATEVRSMKFPDMETIASIGDLIREANITSCSAREHVVLDALAIRGDTRRYLEGLIL